MVRMCTDELVVPVVADVPVDVNVLVEAVVVVVAVEGGGVTKPATDTTAGAWSVAGCVETIRGRLSFKVVAGEGSGLEAVNQPTANATPNPHAANVKTTDQRTSGRAPSPWTRPVAVTERTPT